ncbi:MAG: hypothetical protein IJ348_00400 [Alistipes sp.]|nr:hypothetical protein [Alistipes sp.]
MKKLLLFAVLAVSLPMMLTSCQQKENVVALPVESEDFLNSESFTILRAGVSKVEPQLVKLGEIVNSSTRSVEELSNDPEVLSVIQSMLPIVTPYTTIILDEFAFTTDDLNEIFGTNYTTVTQMEAEIVSFTLFFTYFYEYIVTASGFREPGGNGGWQPIDPTDPPIINPNGSIADLSREDHLDCIEEALGINLINTIATNPVRIWSKVAIKSLMKNVARSFFGYAGLVLMVGEYALCITDKADNL